MLSLAITVLFALTGLIATATVAHCLVEARAAYVRLMREGEVMRAGFALQAAAVEMALRPAPRRAMATRRAGLPVGLPLARPAFAA
ncbi:MAG: hypothetical protein NBV68_16940 [Erythrobacter sp.]|uniref:hypothetical protein n=1 Tax=Erythrobacter sp. TaxID=1042 RepID=UPI0025DCFDCC|nr:hypothetical protein [Erythrobacter sp.]MCM0001062.1 hypothetical protein [Erythrobacter sp.]